MLLIMIYVVNNDLFTLYLWSTWMDKNINKLNFELEFALKCQIVELKALLGNVLDCIPIVTTGRADYSHWQSCPDSLFLEYWFLNIT